jgi:pimeloyl-ACP methyl ester carboxylesterase
MSQHAEHTGAARAQHVAVAPGVALHVEERRGRADAAPFILVHGLASNLRLWDGVAGELHARGHTVVAVDQRGHGRSDTPESGYELDTAVADLLALTEALGLARPVLAGQSWGGNVVLELAWRRPDAVRGIACVDGGIAELGARYPAWEECLAALSPPSLDHLTMAELRARLRKANPSFPPGALAAYEHCFRERPDGTIEPRLARPRHIQILRSLWEHRPASRYATLSTPAILLLADTGEATRTAAKRQAEAAALASGGNIRSRWFSPGHHDLHLQFPREVAEVLVAGVRDGFFA